MCANTTTGDEKGGEEHTRQKKSRKRESESPGHARGKYCRRNGRLARWEGYNERLAISSINIFRRFVTKELLLPATATGRCARFATRLGAVAAI